MRKLVFSLILVSLLLPQKFRVVDEVLAIVGDEIITLSEVKAYEANLIKYLQSRYSGEQLKKAIEEARKHVLDDLIDQKVLLNKAKEEGITVDEELKMVLQNMAKEYGFSGVDELIVEMEKEGIDFEQWKEQAKKSLMQQKLIQRDVESKIRVTEGQIRTYYEQHKDEFTEPAKVVLKAIFLSAQGRSEQQLRQLAEKVDEALKQKSFEEVAAELSDEPLRSRKGDLGEMNEAHLSQEFRKVIKATPKGEVTDWVKTDKGWYKFKVIKKIPERVIPLSKVREKIQRKLFQQQRDKLLKEYIQEIKKQTFIKILRHYPEEI